tara:strand:- start:418 stop:1395 length:978 start_codon:yes stop_codon:yes gene_type:complete
MNTTIFFSKLFLDACRDTYKVYNYFKLKKNNNFTIFYKIFFIKFFYAFEILRNRIKPNFDVINQKKKIPKNDIFNEELNLVNLVKDLDSHGYTKNHTIKDNITEDILKEALNYDNFDINKLGSNIEIKDLMVNKGESLNEYINRLSSLGISRLTKTIDLNNENLTLNKVILSDEIISVAKSYLNTKKLSINATFFISNPLKTNEEEKYKNAQYFHWDNDFTKFFKLYIYLNDVNLDNGPHIFVPGTHKIKKQENKLCRLFSDENINRNYSQTKTFLGKKGTFFLVDSYGIHKGLTPKNNYRLMLNIHFGKGKILYSENDKYINFN